MNIVFFARVTDIFSPKTLQTKSLGGTESSLYYLAKALAKLGHNVTVINNCREDAGVYDNVRYIDYDPNWGLFQTIEYSKKNHIDRLIIVRDFMAPLFPIRADKKLFWAHDDFSTLNIYPEQPDGIKKNMGKTILNIGGKGFKNIDKVVTVSHWQAEPFVNYMGVPESKIYVSANGIDTDLFNPEGITRLDNRLIYTSVPERGLELLVTRIFPIVRKKRPDTELHVFSYRDLTKYKLMKIEGLVIRGKATKADLAKELMQATLWTFPQLPSHPNYNAETFCIAAAEAQCAMTVPVSSNRGAIPETTINGKTSLLVDWEYPVTDKFVNNFADAIISLLDDRKKREEMGKAGREMALERFNWDNIAKKFSTMLETL